MPVDDVPADSLPKSRTVVLVVAERARRDGKYSAHHNGRLVVANSTQPFLDAARVLLAQGLDPGARYVMRRSPDGSDALISTLGQAAKLAVREDDRVGPMFVRHQPMAEEARAALRRDRNAPERLDQPPLGADAPSTRRGIPERGGVVGPTAPSVWGVRPGRWV
jgi:hypothetical protein